LTEPRPRGMKPYMLKRYSRIAGTQPQEYESRIPPGEPCIRQEHVHIQGLYLSTGLNMNRIPYFSRCSAYSQTLPSVSFHRGRCVSVWCAERLLSVLEARVKVCRGESLRRLKFSRWHEEIFARASMFDLAV